MQKPLIRFISSLILGLLVFSLHASTKINEGSNVYKVSSIEILNDAKLSIFSERVNMNIEGNYSTVRVSYEFWNNEEVDLPVEFALPIYYMSDEGSKDVFHWEADYVTDIKIWLEDGTVLNVSEKADPSLRNDSLHVEGKIVTVHAKRKLFLAKFTMPKITSKTVNVAYKVKNYYKDISGEQSFIPKYHSRAIQYDFKPALRWGNGIIRDFSMILDASQIPRDFMHLDGNVFKDLKWQDGIYVLNQTDFPINYHSIMYVEYDQNIAILNEFINTYLIPQEVMLRTKPSSQADVYSGVENLYDRNYGSAWAEGESGAGVGEWIEIILDDYPLSAVAIINGLPKTADDYEENTRIAKVKIERQYIDANNVIRTDALIADIPDEKYRRVNENNFSKLLSVIADYGNGDMYKVRKLRITILGVYPGAKYEKTCISELFLLGKE